MQPLEQRAPEDRVALVVFSGDLDRVLGAFVIATGAAAMGQQVSMFFAFWFEPEPSRLAHELLWRRRQNAPLHDADEERQLAGGDGLPGEGAWRAHDRLRNVTGVGGLECGGVASFLADSLKSRTSLFI